MSIHSCQEQRSRLYLKIRRYKRSCERSALISKRKYYELISLFARNMLSRLPVISDDPDFHLSDASYKPLNTLALLMIWEMHDKWRDHEDLSLSIPENLDEDKKEIIENHLHTIQMLDQQDEAEGTFAYLLHDYCMTMILYNCASQFAYGTDLETVRSVYGEYTDEAYELYEDTIYEMKEGDEPEDIELA